MPIDVSANSEPSHDRDLQNASDRAVDAATLGGDSSKATPRVRAESELPSQPAYPAPLRRDRGAPEVAGNGCATFSREPKTRPPPC